MTGLRSVVIRFGLLAACVAASSWVTLASPSIFAQESASVDQIHQTCLNQLDAWIFKDPKSDESCCARCSEAGEASCESNSSSSRCAQKTTNESAAWTELWMADEDSPTEVAGAGLGCTQACHQTACAADGCDAEVCQSDCCRQGECGECDFCRDICTTPENSAYCKDLAELLCTTIHGNDMSEPAMRRAIEKAMMLVARNAKSESLIEMANMEAKHRDEQASLRGQLLQLSTQVHTVNDLRNWIGPLYTNQNRTIQHLQLMSASSNTLNRTLSLLEKQLSSKAASQPTSVKYSNPHVVQNDPDSKVYYLEREIGELKQQLQKMQQMRTDKIQPAQHLQPIYDSSQQLEPLESPPFPATMNWAPKSNDDR